MTREEAERILDRRTTIPGDGASEEEINEAIDFAIEALRIVELIDKTFEWNSDLMMDHNDWSEILTDIRGE